MTCLDCSEIAAVCHANGWRPFLCRAHRLENLAGPVIRKQAIEDDLRADMEHDLQKERELLERDGRANFDALWGDYLDKQND